MISHPKQGDRQGRPYPVRACQAASSEGRGDPGGRPACLPAVALPACGRPACLRSPCLPAVALPACLPAVALPAIHRLAPSFFVQFFEQLLVLFAAQVELSKEVGSAPTRSAQ
jgi:hypothetical protein